MLAKASSSSMAIVAGTNSIATGITVVGIPVSAGLAGLGLAGSSLYGFFGTALIKKYQKKLQKITKLLDTVTSAIAVFETNISETLKNNRIDENEFRVAQGIFFKALNDLSNIDRKMGKETRTQFEKSLLDEINQIKDSLQNENSRFVMIFAFELWKIIITRDKNGETSRNLLFPD